MTETTASRDRVDLYYRTFHGALRAARDFGETRLHFGILPAVPPNYCWFTAALQPGGDVRQAATIVLAMDELENEAFAPLDSAPPRTVLDVGAGYGATLTNLGLRWPGAALTALNPQPEQAAEGRQRTAAPGIEWLELSAEEYRPEQPFDLVYLFESAFHMPDKRQLLENASSWLAPAGTLCIVDVVLAERLGEGWNSRERPGDLFHYVSRQRWCELARQVGLVETGFSDFSPGVARFLTSAPVARLAAPFREVAEREGQPELEAGLAEIHAAYRRLRTLLEAGFLQYVALYFRPAP